MMTEKALDQTIRKLSRLASMLHERLFEKIDTLPVSFYQLGEPLYQIPQEALFAPLPSNRKWGCEGGYGWFHGQYTVPESLDGEVLYLFPHIGGYEATMYVNGQMTANFTHAQIIGSHGNHYAKPFTLSACAGETLSIDLEYYAYHDMPGTQPFTNESYSSYEYDIGSVDICTRDAFRLAYWADLTTLLSLVESLDASSFRRADVLYSLYQVHAQLYYDEENAPQGEFMVRLRQTHPILQAQLTKRNSESAPFVGLIGHSHMDTAWLWPIAETINKCARTYANQLSLMQQYPDYLFVQSSAYHSEMIRRHDPGLFARIKAQIANGRYEPNGGVWVECDCNLTGGEAMVRQFLWGQRYTMQHFGYRSDTFWLPDTFGYSAAIPQIMKGCGIDYFLTTKMAWNDTTKFPYTSFYWQGMDGTRVLTHLNRTHIGPDPQMLNELTLGGDTLRDPIMEKLSSDMRLFSFGKGDGGGGPEFEMIELAARVKDLEGVARSEYITVSAFMQRLEKTLREPSVYAGEMYLELHRGTLTNQHNIKRNNRTGEIALHNLEYFTVRDAIDRGVAASAEAINPLMETLLVNQFHDILPGTCIQSVHEQSVSETSELIGKADALSRELVDQHGGTAAILHNTLGFSRTDTLYLPGREGMRIRNVAAQQLFTDMRGDVWCAVNGVKIPSFGAAALEWEAGEIQSAAPPFTYDGTTLTTPFAVIRFNDNGAMASFIDRSNGRELVAAEGCAFNTFLMAEDVSAAWDNWDVDPDLECKFEEAGQLIRREVVAMGGVECRIRSVYRLSDRSTLTQDMIFGADSPMIAFDTLIDWQDAHRFLKTAFDTSLLCDGVRSEIQFGFLRRSNHRSTDVEKARFETCNHKYSDLSETGYGIALLNDCKYGLSVSEGSMRLSLHKGGILPDKSGDRGVHHLRYALLPHASDFGAESVIQPAYCFNYAPLVADGHSALHSLVTVDCANVIIETLKPCEDTDSAYILRAYESAGQYANAEFCFNHPVTALAETNMLEETLHALPAQQALRMVFRPFEIKTLRIAY